MKFTFVCDGMMYGVFEGEDEKEIYEMIRDCFPDHLSNFHPLTDYSQCYIDQVDEKEEPFNNFDIIKKLCYVKPYKEPV